MNILDFILYDGECCVAWVGAAVGAALSIGNAIWGSMSAQKERRDQIRAINRAENRDRAWRDRQYYQDATQSAEAQRAFTKANEFIKGNNQSAMGRKAVIGGTDASVATTKQANANSMANAMGDIAANAEAQKRNVDQQYHARSLARNDQKAGINANYEQRIQNNTAQAATTGIAAMASLGDISGKGDSTSATPKTTKGGGNVADGIDESQVIPAGSYVPKVENSPLASTPKPQGGVDVSKYQIFNKKNQNASAIADNIWGINK